MGFFNLFGKGNKMAKDPVCGMDVDPNKTTLIATHEGQSYYFCAPSCLKAFQSNPAKYLAAASAMSGTSGHGDSHHGGMGGGKKHGCC